MEKKRIKSNEKNKNLSAVKRATAAGKTAATRKPGKTGATGIIKKTDTTERPVRTGKTGATGLIRETSNNGMTGMPAAGEGPKGLRAGKAMTIKPLNGNGVAKKGGRKRVPVILVTNDDGINAPGIRNLVEAVRGLGKIVVVAPDKP